MELSSKQILKTMRLKGIRTFYHADTVRTSCSFLKRGRLLSRGELEDQGLPMRGQISDSKDKTFGLWYSVFVDGVDIHNRIKGRNFYGPVLFCIDISILEQEEIPTIRVTKSNPKDWAKGMPKEGRYFRSAQEFEVNYSYGDFAKMFVLPSRKKGINLSDYLERIVLDYTRRTANGSHLYERAIESLKDAAEEGSLRRSSLIKIQKRRCLSTCDCQNQYQKMHNSTILKFFEP